MVCGSATLDGGALRHVHYISEPTCHTGDLLCILAEQVYCSRDWANFLSSNRLIFKVKAFICYFTIEGVGIFYIFSG